MQNTARRFAMRILFGKIEFHLGHLGPLNFYLTIQKFSIELQSLFWYRIYHQTKLDVLLVNSYEKLRMKLEIKQISASSAFSKITYSQNENAENAEIPFLSS